MYYSALKSYKIPRKNLINTYLESIKSPWEVYVSFISVF